MSDPYTPTTASVRLDYATTERLETLRRFEAFDRWLSAHDARVRAKTLKDALPEGAKWFPDEGGIMWGGKVYYPADYVMTRDDIAQVRAEAWDEGTGHHIGNPNPYRSGVTQ